MKLSSLIACLRVYPDSIVYREGVDGKHSIISLPKFDERIRMYNLFDREVLRWEFDNSFPCGRLTVVLDEKVEESEESEDTE